MIRTFKSTLVGGALLFLFGTGVAPAVAAEDTTTYTMKLAHILNPGSPRDRLFHEYGANLEKRTNGRIKYQVYPSAQLGDNEQIIEGVQSGAIQGTMSPTAFMSGFEPLLSVLDLPMLFETADESSVLANGQAGDLLIEIAKDKGVMGLGFYGEGAKNMVTTFPFESLKDLKGKRIRSMPNPVMLQQFKEWGANPVPIGVPELYNALQDGAVLGQEQEWGIVNDLKYFEVSPYLAESAHGMLVDFFFVSKQWYDALPQDLQVAVVEEAQKLIPVFLEWQNDYNDSALEEMKNKPKVVYSKPSAAAIDEMKAASKPVHEWFVKQYGPKAQELLDLIQEDKSKL